MAELKTQNEKKLVGVVLIALIPLYISFFYLHPDLLRQLAESPLWGSVPVGLSPLFLITVLVIVTSNAIHSDSKACLVYMRREDPLPASRAHLYMRRDTRIDYEDLPPEAQALMDESLTPRQRNSRWYKNIFKAVDDMPAVRNTHRTFLLFRDATPVLYLYGLVILLSDIIGRHGYDFPLMTWQGYVVMVFYALLVHWTAAQAGKRMVTGAIANFTQQHNRGS